jgi:hypothetical protein
MADIKVQDLTLVSGGLAVVADSEAVESEAVKSEAVDSEAVESEVVASVAR